MDLTSKSGIPSQGAGFQVVAPMGGEDKAPQDNKRGLEEQAADLGCGIASFTLFKNAVFTPHNWSLLGRRLRITNKISKTVLCTTP